MFNSGFRGKRAGDNQGSVNPQQKFIQTKYPVPTITSWSISGSDDTALNTAGGQTVLVNGTGFASGCAVTLNGATVTPVTFVNSTQISFTSPALSGGSYTLVVYNSTGGGAILVPGLTYSSVPTYTTAAGSIGSGYETNSISTSVVATSDSSITYAITSGSLPAGASMTTGGVITGTYPVVASGSSTTYSFDITATDAELQDVTRSFTLTTNIDVVTWATPSSGATINLDGTAYSQALSASSAAGKSITYSADTLPTGLTLSSGTISGTPTVDGSTSTVLTATAATTNRSATNTVTWVVALNDAYFKYTTMLLSASNSVQTSSFVNDNSINNTQLTIAGDTRAQSFNPYQLGYYSILFNGTSDYLTLPHNSGYSIASGSTDSFNFEAFIYRTTTGAVQAIVDKSGVNPTTFWNWRLIITASNYIQLDWGSTGSPGSSTGTLSGTTALVSGKWYHIAFAKTNADWSVFINGVREFTYNGLNTASDSVAGLLRIGYDNFTGYFTGYMSNIRIYNGATANAYYSATSTTITVPTSPLLWKTNVSLLAANSNRYTDGSMNNATISVGGGAPKITTVHPFSTVYQAGTQYYSTKFDGTGDYLTVPYNSAFDVAGGSFTVECWVNMTGLFSTNIDSQRVGTIAEFGPATTNVGWEFIINQTANEIMFSVQGVLNRFVCSYTFTIGQWYHIAVVRNGSSNAIYVNGIAQTLTTNNYTGSSATSGDVTVGTARRFAGYTHDFLGNISNLRIVKGTALYSTNFTPSTSLLTAVSGTSLLTCQDSTLKDNSTNNFAITSNGDAKPVAVSPFTPSSYTNTEITTYGSGYFDGTGDWINVPYSGVFNTGATYTIESWVYPTVLNSYNMIFTVSNSNVTNFGGWLLWCNASGTVYFECRPGNGGSNVQVIGGTVPLNTWSHIAVSVNSNAVKLFVNGVQVQTGTVVSLDGTQNYVGIGALNNGATASPFTGYISNVRLIKGTALYTYNFAPQFTSPLSNVTNTQLLTLQTNGAHNNSTFKDQSSFNNLITRNGNVTNGTFSPYGDNWSTYLSSATVAGPSTHSVYADANEDFTFECWFNLSSTTSDNMLMGWNKTSTFDYIDINPTGYNLNMNNTYSVTGSKTWSIGTWYHFAVSRNSGSVKVYIDGTLNATVSNSNSIGSGSVAFKIGDWYTTPNHYFNGYVSNLRWVKGTGLYSNGCTPSTTPLTTVSGTTLLTCQSNRFIDNSPNNYTLTPASATVQKFSPFGTVTVPKYYSTYFDGNGDYLTIPDNSAWTVDSDYTIEFWVNCNSFPGQYNNIISQRGGASSYWGINYDTTLGWALFWNNGAGETKISRNQNSPLNTWVHVAIVKSGTTGYMFLNGTQAGATFSFPSITDVSSLLYVGAWYTPGDYISGNLSNLRMVKGTALYTSNFTPSTTPLTAVSGTVLLTCQDSTFKDNSTNNFVVTSNGDAKPLPVSPFTPTASSQTSYSTTTFGGSMYFDGTSDYLSTPYNAAWDINAGDFTLEMWLYRTVGSVQQYLIHNRPGSGSYGWGFDISSSNVLNFYFTAGSSLNGVATVPTNAWVHIAAVMTRSNNTLKFFINGVLDSSGTSFGTGTTSTTTPIIIGCDNGPSYAAFYTGYMTDVRIIKGTALYTSNFYPGSTPATPATTIGTTTYSSSLLLNGASSGVIDASRTVDLETVADAKVTNFSPYNGSYYSNYFDGTGDYLTLPSNQTQFTMGTGDFTIEMWINVSDFSAQRTLYDTMNGGDTGGTGRFALEITTGGVLRVFTAAGTILTSATSVTISAGVWYHIAYVRVSNSGKLYINGNQVNNTYTDNNNYVVGTTSRPIIGINAYDNSSNPMKGYISNLRVVKGSGLYTGAFTPSTSPLTAVSGTSLLTCQSNKFVDNSTNNFTITKGGDTKVATQNPFQVNTGQSYYFDGTGDYMTVTTGTGTINFGTGDFTIELWVYFSSNNGTYNPFIRVNGGSQLDFGFDFSVNQMKYSTSVAVLTSSWTPIVGQWYHVALVRTSSVAKAYVNGSNISGAGAADSFNHSVNATGTYYRIGGSDYNAGHVIYGYIADLRITKGYARTISVPSGPYKTN